MTSFASATVLTFEGQANEIYTAPIVRSGFLIGNPAAQEQHFHEINGFACDYSLPCNGTGILLNDRDTQIFIAVNGGGTFRFSGTDYATATNNNPGNDLSITGFLGATQQFSTTLAMTGTFATTGGSNVLIDRVVFDGLGGQGGFVLDNVVLNGQTAGVPEPGTLWLLAAGAAAIAFARRR